MAVRRCKKEDLKRIARATGGRKGIKTPGQGGHISSDQHAVVLFQLRHTSNVYMCMTAMWKLKIISIASL